MATILIIDDEPVFRRVTRAMLERLGHTVHELSEASHAREVYRVTGADVVLLDVLMPDQDGIETLKLLREFDPKVRIILTSGGGKLTPKFYFDFTRHMKVEHHLAKPFSMIQLEAAVHGALSQPRRRSETGADEASDAGDAEAAPG